MAGYVPLEIEAYTNFSRTVIVRNIDGTSQNLVGFTANSQMRRSFYSSKANTITTTITDAPNGQITMSMTAANTGLLIPGRYVYDVVTTGGGITQRMIEGIVVVSAGVTQ